MVENFDAKTARPLPPQAGHREVTFFFRMNFDEKCKNHAEKFFAQGVKKVKKSFLEMTKIDPFWTLK